MVNKNNFFVNEKIVDISVEGEIFKYKPSTAGDELNWLKDYTYIEKRINKDTGEDEFYNKEDSGKLALCKLRNIVEVPFNQEELKEICGINKAFTLYSNEEKDLLFSKLSGDVFNFLIKSIDGVKEVQKKE